LLLKWGEGCVFVGVGSEKNVCDLMEIKIRLNKEIMRGMEGRRMCVI